MQSDFGMTTATWMTLRFELKLRRDAIVVVSGSARRSWPPAGWRGKRYQGGKQGGIREDRTGKHAGDR